MSPSPPTGTPSGTGHSQSESWARNGLELPTQTPSGFSTRKEEKAKTETWPPRHDTAGGGPPGSALDRTPGPGQGRLLPLSSDQTDDQGQAQGDNNQLLLPPHPGGGSPSSWSPLSKAPSSKTQSCNPYCVN